jgi:hypothetical protein
VFVLLFVLLQKEQRKAFLAAKKQHEEVAVSEKKKDEIEESKESIAAMEALVEKATNENICTYCISERSLVLQPCYQCITCNLTKKGEGVCFQCYQSCHKGHEVRKADNQHFFCDCGSRSRPNHKCNKNKTEQEKQEQTLIMKKRNDIDSSNNPGNHQPRHVHLGALAS